jgi:tetratricopeptide (TPR) repeat protein
MIWRYFKQLRSDFKLIGQTEVSRVSTTQAEQESLQDCEARSIGLDQRMQHLWIPGRRWWLIRQSYDVGYVARQRDAAALAERNFRRAIDLMEDKCPRRSKSSLATFAIVAACHNHLGLLYLDERRMDDAIVAFDAAIALRRELRGLFPQDRENEVYLGGALCNRGYASADIDPKSAASFYNESLTVLRQPIQTCECSYWDELRQSWWCEQLEVMGQTLRLPWVALAPQFIDNAMIGLRSLETKSSSDE